MAESTPSGRSTPVVRRQPAKPVVRKTHAVPPVRSKPAAAPPPPPPSAAPPRPPPAPAPTVAVDRADTPLRVLPPGVPRPVLSTLPTTDIEHVNNALAREIVDPTAEAPAAVDPTIAVLDQLVNGILNGTDLNPIRSEVSRILASQRDKARVVAALVQNHDFHRINLLMQMRSVQELRLHAAAQRGDLTTAESLALFRLADTALAQIMPGLKKTIEEGHSEQGTSVDATGAALDRMDGGRRDNRQQQEVELAGTTAHGREIIRKRLYDEARRLSERATPGPVNA